MAIKKDGELEMQYYCESCDEDIDLEMWVVDEEEGKIGISGFHAHIGDGETTKLPALIFEFPNHHIASRFRHKMELITKAMRDAAGEKAEEDDD